MTKFKDYKESKASWKADPAPWDALAKTAYAARKKISEVWDGTGGKDDWWYFDIDPDTMAERIYACDGEDKYEKAWYVNAEDKRVLASMTADISGKEYDYILFDTVEWNDAVTVAKFDCENGDVFVVFIALFDHIGDEITPYGKSRPLRM